MIIKILLSPFSFLFYIISFIYHKFHDLFSKNAFSPKAPSISVGNLSVGGTGKTPMVMWLADFLLPTHNLLILSRGYGRKSKGFMEVKENMTFIETGDEPLAYKKMLGDKIKVAVCEKRKDGVDEMLSRYPNTNCILLDDAFQHRSINPGLSILLTTYSSPFYLDYPLPSGSLREPSIGAHRADIIIVTKCPEDLPQTKKKEFINSLNRFKKPIFFSKIKYDKIQSLYKEINSIDSILLVTGIANSSPLFTYIEKRYKVIHLKYSDHYSFTKNNIKEIHQKFNNFASNKMVILTTEKDLVRLCKYESETQMKNYPWYKISISLDFDDTKGLKKIIENYVRQN